MIFMGLLLGKRAVRRAIQQLWPMDGFRLMLRPSLWVSDDDRFTGYWTRFVAMVLLGWRGFADA